jgi:hypothetical protein
MPKAPVSTLYNHSQRAVVSHQISTSSGSTTSGRRHATYNTTTIDVPVLAPDPGDDPGDEMDVDAFQPDSVEDDQEPYSELQKDIAELPGLKVHATKRAKRYTNSVNFMLSISFFIDHCYRIYPFTPGRLIVMNTSMNAWL